MTAGTETLERVPAVLRDAVRRYVERVRQTDGLGARALVLYGPAGSGEYDPQVHAVQSVLVVERIDLDALRRFARHGPQLGRWGIVAPLVMTPGYIRDSLDAFPLQLLEIGQTRVTVFGEDHFAALHFEPAHVRLQCERELKAALIDMRQALLAAAGREELVDAIESAAADALLRTLRGLLWLRGRREALPAAEVLAALEELTGRSLPGLRLAIRHGTTRDWSHFESLYRDVERLGELVNGW